MKPRSGFTALVLLGFFVASLSAQQWTPLPAPVPAAPKRKPDANPVITFGRPSASMGRPRVRMSSPKVRSEPSPRTTTSLGAPVRQRAQSPTPYSPEPSPRAYLEPPRGSAPSTGFAIDRLLPAETKEPKVVTSFLAPVPRRKSGRAPATGLTRIDYVDAELTSSGPVSGPLQAVPAPEVLGADPVMMSCPVDGGAATMGQWYGGAEYLLWWLEDEDVVPLATTSQAQDLGILGQPTTQILSDGPLDRDLQSGGRFTLGRWFGDGNRALELSGFFLGERSDQFFASSNQFPTLARPFFSIDRGQELSQLVALPGLATGNLMIDAPSRMWGLEVNMRRSRNRCGTPSVDFLYGFRYLNLSEGLFIQENITTVALLPGLNVQPGTGVVVSDSFQTHNHFYGGQVGAQANWGSGMWSFTATGKLALGYVHQVSKVTGGQALFAPDGTVTGFNGGLLALSSNSGRFENNEFAVVPEVGFKVGCQVTPGMRVTAGYNFLYVSSVLRPAAQIDRVLDVNLVPNGTANPVATGLNRPAPQTNTDSIFAQGLTFGLEFNW